MPLIADRTKCGSTFPGDYDWRYRDAHRDNGQRFVVRADENQDPNHSSRRNGARSRKVVASAVSADSEIELVK